MRKLIILTALLTLSSTIVLAQPRRGFNRMYDPKTVQTVSGTIVSVDRVNADRPMRGGVHLTLQTATQTLDVALGPAFYIDELKMKFEKSDSIDVKGSLVKIAGKDVLIAAEVKKNGETIVLRDENGVPAWAGRRR